VDKSNYIEIGTYAFVVSSARCPLSQVSMYYCNNVPCAASSIVNLSRLTCVIDGRWTFLVRKSDRSRVLRLSIHDRGHPRRMVIRDTIYPYIITYVFATRIQYTDVRLSIDLLYYVGDRSGYGLMIVAMVFIFTI